MTPMAPPSPGKAELLPITIKAMAWLKKQYVEFKDPSINPCAAKVDAMGHAAAKELGDSIFTASDNLDKCIKEELAGVTSFLEFVVVVQMHQVLATKVARLSKDYWYSTTYGEEAGSGPVTVASLKRMLVHVGEAGECWSMLGFVLTDKEADNLIRLLENFDGDRHLDDHLVLHNITL